MDMLGMQGALFWLIISIALFVIEGMTVQLVTIWFAIGALAAMLFSFLGAPLWLQLAAFLVASIGVLIVGRPIVKHKLEVQKVPTNADQVIGQTGLVLEEIDNRKQAGRVRANGLDWTARALLDEMVIPAQSQVRVIRIDGVKLIVESLNKTEEDQES